MISKLNTKSISPQRTAVVLVDFQADFTEDKKGALAVPKTDRDYINLVVATLNQAISNDLPIYATQDWHPINHSSFYTNHSDTRPFDTITLNGRSQIMWPPHCVQGTDGAKLLIDKKHFREVVKKGMDARFDSYSGFADDGGKKTGLEDILHRDGIDALLIFGLATDFCVKATTLDALKSGFRVYLWPALCRGVAPDTTTSALQKCQTHGAHLVEKDFFRP